MSMSSFLDFTKGPLLGRGSTATVTLASTSSSSLFAVKTSPISFSTSLRREHLIHSSLPPSPYIISYLGSQLTPQSFHLFLEYAPLGPLSLHLPLPYTTIKSYTLHLLLALSHLHSFNFAHCDLKPDNILISSNGSPKLADLGCATLLTSGCAEFMGSPMYMAPEVARGKAQGAEADVWALGCVVVEMLTGRPPWPDESDVGRLLYRVGFMDSGPEVPEWVEEEGRDFLDKCFRRERKQRWSVQELLMHPFVSGSGLGSGSDLECKWTSPKSTLDQSIWDFVEEKDVSVEIESSLGIGIQELFSSRGPNWGWDESWVEVRGNSEISGVISSTISVNQDGDSGNLSGSCERDESTVSSTDCDDNYCDRCEIERDGDMIISYKNDDYWSVLINLIWISNRILFTSTCHIAFCPFPHRR